MKNYSCSINYFLEPGRKDGKKRKRKIMSSNRRIYIYYNRYLQELGNTANFCLVTTSPVNHLHINVADNLASPSLSDLKSSFVRSLLCACRSHGVDSQRARRKARPESGTEKTGQAAWAQSRARFILTEEPVKPERWNTPPFFGKIKSDLWISAWDNHMGIEL